MTSSPLTPRPNNSSGALSSDMGESVRDEANQKNRPSGLLFESPKENVYV